VSIEVFAIGVAVVFVAGLLWAWYKDITKQPKKPELEDMTEAELAEAMERLGNQYKAMSAVIRERRFQDQIARTLTENDDPWDNGQVGL